MNGFVYHGRDMLECVIFVVMLYSQRFILFAVRRLITKKKQVKN